MNKSASISILVLLICGMVSSYILPLAKATQDNPFIINRGIQLDDFNHNNNWVLGAGIKANDTVNFINGTMSLKLTTIGSNSAYITKSINLNLANTTNFVFYIYVNDYTAISKISLYISSSPTFSNYFVVNAISSIASNHGYGGWKCISVLPSDFTNVGGDSWSNPMRWIRFMVTSYKTVNVSFASLYKNMMAKSVVLISFDDGYGNIYDNAYPILKANNQVATVFMITNRVGYTKGPVFMTLTQLTNLYNAGWCISSHTVDHLSLITQSKATLNTELNGSLTWLNTNGFGSTAPYFAYPFGELNATVINYVDRIYRMARGTENGTYFGPLNLQLGEQYYLPWIQITNITTVSHVKAEIDRAVVQGTVISITFHQVVNSGAGASTQVLTSTFQSISNYLAANQAAGKLVVMTYNQYYDTFYPSSETGSTNIGFTANGLKLFIVIILLIISIVGVVEYFREHRTRRAI